MREDIKKRIEIIQKGEVPEGYKRFMNTVIPESWITDTIENLFVFYGGLGKSRDELGSYGIPYLHYGDMHKSDSLTKTYTEYLDAPKCDVVIQGNEPFLMRDGDMLFLDASEDLTGTYRAVVIDNPNNYHFIAGLHTFIGRQKVKRISKEYLQYITQPFIVSKQFMRMASGIKVSGINRNTIKPIQVIFPTKMDEQKKIACILGNYDKKRNLLVLLIEEKQKKKKWLMQNLLTGKKRLKGFDTEWKKEKLGKLIFETNEKTSKNNEFEILSVTKNGIYKQSEHFNKQIASEDNVGYKILRKGNLVFSTMNLWMGSLDVLNKYDIGIVSPAYKTFDFNSEYMTVGFGEHFMKSSYMIWIYNINSEQGASIVRKNLDLSGLLNTYVKVPSIEEQKAIAKILFQADKEIELLQQRLEQIKLEKKAMMQLLLTGIVRVNQKGGE